MPKLHCNLYDIIQGGLEPHGSELESFQTALSLDGMVSIQDLCPLVTGTRDSLIIQVRNYVCRPQNTIIITGMTGIVVIQIILFVSKRQTKLLSCITLFSVS